MGRKRTGRKHFPTSPQIGFILPDERPTDSHRPPAPPLAARAALSPVPLSARHNGWSVDRQARFLGHLAETGSVSAACMRVGMSRNGAYKLRGKRDAESFAAAWDAVLGIPARKVTTEDLQFLAYHGLVHSRFRGGKYLGWLQKPDNSALLRLLARFDRMIGKR